jgi:hypothetical protein
MLCKIIGINKLTDPLSGFFLIKTDVMNKIKHNIKNKGFKVLVSILYNIKNIKKIKEIQTNFYQRKKGRSKLSYKVQIQFILQIANLFFKKF